MSAARRYAPHYTVKDYQHWEGAWELWDGIAVAMSPGPFGRHQAVVRNLLVQLHGELKRKQCEAEVVHEVDWIVRSDTVVRPDLVMVCGKLPDRYLDRVPEVVIEVLSEATRERDRTYKRELYEEQGVAVYLMVDSDTETIECLVRGASDKWRTQPGGGTIGLKICDHRHVTLDVADIFAR